MVLRLEKFREDTPTSPKVIGANTLNFKPHFKFSRLIFWGTPVPFGWALTNLGQPLARVKICGGSTPWEPKCSRLSPFGWVNISPITFLCVDQGSPVFFVLSDSPVGATIERRGDLHRLPACLLYLLTSRVKYMCWCVVYTNRYGRWQRPAPGRNTDREVRYMSQSWRHLPGIHKARHAMRWNGWRR